MCLPKAISPANDGHPFRSGSDIQPRTNDSEPMEPHSDDTAITDTDTDNSEMTVGTGDLTDDLEVVHSEPAADGCQPGEYTKLLRPWCLVLSFLMKGNTAVLRSMYMRKSGSVYKQSWLFSYIESCCCAVLMSTNRLMIALQVASSK